MHIQALFLNFTQGFTIAIAATIGLKQINYACGLTGLLKHTHFIENVIE